MFLFVCLSLLSYLNVQLQYVTLFVQNGAHTRPRATQVTMYKLLHISLFEQKIFSLRNEGRMKKKVKNKTPLYVPA